MRGFYVFFHTEEKRKKLYLYPNNINMKLSMPTVKGYGNAMRVHGMYGGIRQRGPVKFGGLRQRGPVKFGGMKRRRRRGMARSGYFTQQVPMNSYSFAHGRTRRVKRGRGFLDTLKNIGSKALNIARSVPIASTALGFMGPKFAPAAGVARSLGFARRRRVRRRVGMAKRRVRRGRGLLSSLLGMTGLARRRRRRVGMAKRRVKRGRGLLSNLLSMTGLARRRRVKRGGMRKRRVGYRRLLNVPHF